MDNRSQSRKQIALEHLALARREFEAAVESRIRFIALAREYGNTNAEIGAVLGIGESAVRSMLKRHAKPDCNRCGDEVSPGVLCPDCGLYGGES